MYKTITLLAAFAFFKITIAQNSSTYLVSFKDKNGSNYSVSNPSAYLSDRAIERREKQNIKITLSDLPVNTAYVNAVKSTGVEIKNKSKWFNAICISTDDNSKIELIKQLPFVNNVELLSSPTSKKVSSKFKEEERGVPVAIENMNYKSVTSTAFNYGPSFFQAHQIGVDCLHNLGFTGAGMVVAFLDAGFYKVDSLPAFDSLRVNNQILGTYDVVDGNTSVYEDYAHGMNTLSCVGGNLPGRIVGTAPKASFWLIRTETVFSESLQEEVNWLTGAEFADSVGADVINSSLGYSVFDGNIGDHTYSSLDGNTTIVTKAADWAASKGIFVTSSAGNAAGFPWYKITAPADADSILTVGAVDSSGFVASFSSRGPSYDGRVKPDVAARGLNALVASQYGDVWAESGTSFSSPITAGAVACLWQAHSTATNMEVLKAIQQSASQYFFPDSLIGYGIPDFCVAHIILQNLLGIDSPGGHDDQMISVFPNPYNDNINISFYSNKIQHLNIELFDFEGKKLIEQHNNAIPGNNSIHLKEMESLSRGIYLLRIITPGKSYVEKLVKQ